MQADQAEHRAAKVHRSGRPPIFQAVQHWAPYAIECTICNLTGRLPLDSKTRGASLATGTSGVQVRSDGRIHAQHLLDLARGIGVNLQSGEERSLGVVMLPAQ
ncbi:hypothetical protein GV791_09085 [Nocardia cyriacigeorgica]|uniref:Uncharacterized protein n=1 Tax=Nocardia cyriacigeorgica TaxID=135487 RepID=A0A6P1CRE2_9NOCA|nr:hypothetical protein [Nocardia cyriacigeorgica]NEW32715.1 hypothetical protein [Nocardia cyriacigeorgica]BDT87313.1 hypothetical protein FMUAM8_30770 [Nocardia cyriacigeorgica]